MYFKGKAYISERMIHLTAMRHRKARTDWGLAACQDELASLHELWRGGGASTGPKAPSGPELKRRMQAAKKDIKENHPTLKGKVDTVLQRRGEGKHKFEERVLLAEQKIERAKVAHAEREARGAAARA